MANVNQINETAKPLTGPVKNTAKTAQGDRAFNALLNTAMEKADDSEGTAQVAGLQELDAPGFNLKTPSDIVTGKTDQLLERLDSYAAQLGDPDISLKSIAPVLEQMNAEAKSLIEETRYLAAQDDGLKNIATQTAAVAQTEYIRFQRGDYLS